MVVATAAVIAAFLLGSPAHRDPGPGVTSTAPATAAPLVVGDNRTVRLISLGGATTDGLLNRVAADIDGAVGAVERFWGTDWEHEIVIIATDSDAQFVAEAGLDPRRQWSDIAAVSVADSVDLEHRRAGGQRIVFSPGAVAMSEASLRIVLTHELFHLAARTDTALDAPRWLVEGVADFVARPAAPLPAGAAADTSLPSDAALDAAGPARAMGYDRAWWFARFVADTYGVDGLRRLYTDACGPGHPDFPTAVRRALDTDVAELRTRWAQWLTR
ncbi:hypothetical protein [Mycobacterium sp. DL592]|uniref:hypothetical protein n=1 Tax=Mycobacterium sp. DL592 TaxID=2675524 RepID=UPI00352F5975